MAERIYGITPPISIALPTEQEKQLNQALHQELRAQGTFESAAETEKRKRVLSELEKIATAFVRKAAEEKEPKNTILIRDAIGRIFTYGSYRLGVYGPGSDIDTLVVAPKYVTLEQYFDIFPKLLVDMAPPGAITDLSVVRDSFVPIIKFEYSGISIDLIFCSIQTLKQLPADKDWSLADNNLLRGLSEAEIRSLNGTRVTDEILNLVPEPATFKLALRAIKLWAQRKAIYANIMGYPGGVAWAMMVARVCQLYPKATSAVVVNKFFNIIYKWPWPLPVLLKDIEYNCPVTRAVVWNPKIYASDRNHRMPIITPAYPSMCATHNVGRSTMEVIRQELEKGIAITDEIMVGKRPWKDLFAKHTFFTEGFRYYLCVIASSRKEDKHNEWKGLIESKVRLLVNKIENHHQIVLARPFNKPFERVHQCATAAQMEQVVSFGSTAYLYKPPVDGQDGVKSESKPELKQDAKPENGVPNGESVKKDQDGDKGADGTRIKREPSEEARIPTAQNAPPKKEDPDANIKLEDIPEKKEPEKFMIYTANFYIGLQPIEGAKALDLSREVNDWKAMCMNNPQYEPGIRFLSVHHVKNTALPDDVFEPGETRPRPVKKSLKRVASEEPGNGRTLPPAKRNAGSVKPQPKPPSQQQQPQQQQQRVSQQQPPHSTATAAAG
ncbi:hypothetical protein VTJ49DRAFT_2994 [Mycothermus thermophilus]|uniref:Poly(A) polymerase n=1 Tax=Humicola insolens TaxID=85995 RepID=A0ABR3VAI5_HUMIN